MVRSPNARTSRPGSAGPWPARSRDRVVGERPPPDELGVRLSFISAADTGRCRSATIAPTLQPATRSTGTSASSSAASTPKWAKARAPPPASARPSERPAIRSTSARSDDGETPATTVTCQASRAGPTRRAVSGGARADQHHVAARRQRPPGSVLRRGGRDRDHRSACRTERAHQPGRRPVRRVAATRTTSWSRSARASPSASTRRGDDPRCRARPATRVAATAAAGAPSCAATTATAGAAAAPPAGRARCAAARRALGHDDREAAGSLSSSVGSLAAGAAPSRDGPGRRPSGCRR